MKNIKIISLLLIVLFTNCEKVIDVDHNKDEIIEAIQKALFDNDFRKKVLLCTSPYGDGHASERIVAILRDLEISDDLIRKKMTF